MCLIGYELGDQDKDTFTNARGLASSGTDMTGLDVAEMEAKPRPDFL
jgi:hypothetical protein